MRQVSLSEILLLLGFVFVACSLAFTGGAYWQSKRTTLSDTVRVVEYIPQVPNSGTARPIKKPVKLPVHVSVNMPDSTYADSVTIATAEYDSLTTVRYWVIDGQNLGHMEIAYDPQSRILQYYHEPPPLRIEYVDVTREVDLSIWKKAEYVGYGAAVGIILTLLLR